MACNGPSLRDRDDGALLCLPHRRRRYILGDGLRYERQGEIGWFQDDEAELGPVLVMEHEGQVVERDDRMEVLAEHPKQLADRSVSGECLRDAQQRVIAREMCRVERRTFRHGPLRTS